MSDLVDQHVYLFRSGPSRNMSRFYGLEIQPDLFGGAVLVRSWGRLGTFGRECRQWFVSAQEAALELARWAKRKMRRGYLIAHAAY